jgi:uncharacterized protein YdhG (YjbR/CyaY superfamily)
MEDKMKINSIEDYFNSQPEKAKNALLLIRQCILTVATKAKELINYNIPAYALIEGGKREQQIMIAGYKNHVGLYPHPATMEKFEEELKDYKKGKGSVQFPLDKPIPKDLIIKMVEYRLSLINED